MSLNLQLTTCYADTAPKQKNLLVRHSSSVVFLVITSPLTDETEIARISHEHSQRNPYAQFQQEYSLKEISDSTMIHFPLTKLQCSPTSDGAGAAVIVSQKFLDSKPHLRNQAILIAGQQLMTDTPALFSRSAMDLVGYDMTKRAAQAAMREAGVSPKDIKVCELHDCFSANELILLEGLGFSEKGKAHEMVRNGDITYGGKGPVVNPSGGLISKVSSESCLFLPLLLLLTSILTRATLSAQQVWLSAPNSHGSFAAGPTTVSSTATWHFSITSGLVVPSSSTCTSVRMAKAIRSCPMKRL
jgi:hypothetical protein